MFSLKRILAVSFCFFLTISIYVSNANIKEQTKKDKGNQLEAHVATRAFDNQLNTISNFQFYNSNYGIFGFDIARSVGGGVWPRGSKNQYIFAGGIWFGAQKRPPSDTSGIDTNYKRYVELTYNPNSGQSWMVPGRIDDGDKVINTSEAIDKYRVCFSTDFSPQTGDPSGAGQNSKWPIWDTEEKSNLKFDRYFGRYLFDNSLRSLNSSVGTKGPAFISGEDIFSTYKDTDLGYYEGGATNRKNMGYPLRLQFEETIYSWGFGLYKDFVFIRYDIINKSKDTLRKCWMAPVMDVDIALTTASAAGAANDRARYYNEDTTLNLAFQYTNGDRGEQNQGFGYLGFDFLESPAIVKVVDSLGNEHITKETGYLRHDKKFYTNSEQIGLITYRNWRIEEDISQDEPRYAFISSALKDPDNGPGDKRFMMATGPFNMRPGDTCRVVVGIILANTAKGKDADGTTADVAELVAKDKFAQIVYDNNFQAPAAPDLAKINLYPISNGVIIRIDSSSENSIDKWERGLDFMGYKIYRARVTNLDTFNTSIIGPYGTHSKGDGPFGWKQIGSVSMKSPFLKSVLRAGKDQSDATMPFIDSLAVIGYASKPDDPNIVDPFAIKVMRLGVGMQTAYIGHSNAFNPLQGAKNVLKPVLYSIDTGFANRPWGNYYNKLFPASNLPLKYYSDQKNPSYGKFDSLCVGILRLNPAIQRYNPLFYKHSTKKFNSSLLNGLPVDGLKLSTDTNRKGLIDTVFFKNTFRGGPIGTNGAQDSVIDILIPRDTSEMFTGTTSKELTERLVFMNEMLDSVYSFIRNGKIQKFEFNEFESTNEIRNNVIAPYMDSLTNHRIFVDVGDDNKDNRIDNNVDIQKTEKLYNNVDYYYKVVAYDEGDYTQPTPSKENNANFTSKQYRSSNVDVVYPHEAPAGNAVQFNVISADSSRIGGMHNFKFYATNPDRCKQLFDGDTLTLEFNPFPNMAYYSITTDTSSTFRYKTVGTYRTRISLFSQKLKKNIFDAPTVYEPIPCSFGFYDWTEDAAAYVNADYAMSSTLTHDTLRFGMPKNRDKMSRTGYFSTGDFSQSNYCYSSYFLPEALNTLGFSFDYALQQWGGVYRPDTVIKINTSNGPPVNWVYADKGDESLTATTQFGNYLSGYNSAIFTTMPSDNIIFQDVLDGRGFTFQKPVYAHLDSYIPTYQTFNNGPADFIVEFTDGGIEDMAVKWGSNDGQADNNTKTFHVKYLNMKVHNQISLDIPSENGGTKSVKYPMEYKHLPLEPRPLSTDVPIYEPHPSTLKSSFGDFLTSYNMHSFGFISARYKPKFKLASSSARPTNNPGSSANYSFIGKQGDIGTSGRYYLTTIDGADTLDFVNVFVGSSCQFVFDYINKGTKGSDGWTPSANFSYDTPDFKAGDKVELKTFGGVLGLPLPKAQVKVVLEQTVPQDTNSYTDAMMDQIKIVPNPYMLSTQIQKSPYDSRIYFTKLPKSCSISIYTITGDLVKTIYHNEGSSSDPNQVSVDYFDLLSQNNQRVESSAYIAVIKTANATTVKEFSIVVGGFRITQ